MPVSALDSYPDVAIGVSIERIQRVLAERHETLPRRVKVNGGREWKSIDIWTADANDVRTGVSTTEAVKAPNGGWLLAPESTCDAD